MVVEGRTPLMQSALAGRGEKACSDLMMVKERLVVVVVVLATMEHVLL